MNKSHITPDIKFPIIVITPDGTTTFYLNENPLVKVNKNVFTKRIIHESIIIDADAVKYKIQDITNLGYTNKLMGLNIFFEKNIYLQITLQKIKELDLNEFKSYIIKLIDQNEDYYASAGMNVEDMKTQIAVSKDKSEILSMII